MTDDPTTAGPKREVPKRVAVRVDLADAHRVEINEDVLGAWRSRLEQARADEVWVAEWRDKIAGRQEIVPEMARLLEDFLAERIGIEDLRSQYDRKTRKEWNLFGFKGFGGAMFLNMIVKHLPQEVGAAAALRAVLPKPADDATGRARLKALREYLRRQRDEGLLTEAQATEASIPFFVSAWWHIQEPASWPPYYTSVRKALKDSRLFEKGADPIASYFDFRDAFTSLRDALGLDAWGLESLAVWEEQPATEDVDEAPQAARQRVWLISPGKRAEHWKQQHSEGIVAIGWGNLGDLSSYKTKEDVLAKLQELSGSKRKPFHDSNACFNFAHQMQPGDVVVAKKGRSQIVGYGRVTGEYRHEPSRGEYANVRSVDWQHQGEWSPRERLLVTKTLTDITDYPELVRQIMKVVGISKDQLLEAEGETPADYVAAYDLDHAVADLFIEREEIERAWSLLRYKKNLVLQGPPGVGKTFVARRLAYLMLGEKDPERVSVVQFHQSYSDPHDGSGTRRMRVAWSSRKELVHKARDAVAGEDVV